MSRQHGITTTTYRELFLDAGEIYYDFTDLNNPGVLLGATRGGAKFTRKPKYEDLKYEGLVGKVTGSRFLVGVEVSIEVQIVNFNVNNIPKALPNSTVVSNVITETTWDPDAAHVMTNVVLLAQVSGQPDPLIIQINNPVCDNDLQWDFKDKSEAVSKWKFSAFYDASDLETAPWSITYPVPPPPPLP